MANKLKLTKKAKQWMNVVETAMFEDNLDFADALSQVAFFHDMPAKYFKELKDFGKELGLI